VIGEGEDWGLVDGGPDGLWGRREWEGLSVLECVGETSQGIKMDEHFIGLPRLDQGDTRSGAWLIWMTVSSPWESDGDAEEE